MSVYQKSGGNSINPIGDQKQCFMVRAVILNKYSEASFGYSLIDIRIIALCRNKRVLNEIITIMMMMLVMMMIVIMSTMLRDFHLLCIIAVLIYNNLRMQNSQIKDQGTI